MINIPLKRENDSSMKNINSDLNKISIIPKFTLSKDSGDIEDDADDSVGLGHFFKGTSAQDLDKILS